MIKRLLIAIVLLVLVAGGLVGWNMFRDKMIEDFFANMPVQTVTVSAIPAKPQQMTPSIGAIGTVSAARGVELTVETSGIVKTINFDANQRIEEGEVLIQLDDAIQRADLSAGRTQSELDQQSLQRARELQQRGVGSNVTLEAAQAAAAASAAQIEALEAALQQKQIRAPFGGTLGIPRVDIGQYLTPGTAVVTLQDLDTMRVDFTVPEQQLSLLKLEQSISLKADGQDDAFEGKISGIDPRVDAASRLVSVRATVTNPDGRLTPGQFARVDVELPAQDDVIALPQTSVVTSLYGDYVYVVREVEPEGGAAAADAEKKSEARQVFVTVGRRTGDLVEIVKGIEAGDVVVTAGQNRLSNGTIVAIDNTINPGSQTGAQAASQ
ncbi:efflux RND transporter periplasmic adaptor subunit [Mesorhizobium sp. CAU 1732]|uniref:efflux RND transporter periplasmic adaptor subunit n=1 Tax=Mesorhizobium sp. CAU 1732 TaxID=3140358 RepID=UPI003260A3E9